MKPGAELSSLSRTKTFIHKQMGGEIIPQSRSIFELFFKKVKSNKMNMKMHWSLIFWYFMLLNGSWTHLTAGCRGYSSWGHHREDWRIPERRRVPEVRTNAKLVFPIVYITYITCSDLHTNDWVFLYHTDSINAITALKHCVTSSMFSKTSVKFWYNSLYFIFPF